MALRSEGDTSTCKTLARRQKEAIGERPGWGPWGVPP